MKSITGIALLLGALVISARVSAALANQSPVHYLVPASWKLLKNGGSAGHPDAVMYEVKEGVDPNASAVVILKVYKQPRGLNVDNVNIDEAAKQVLPSGVAVSEADDGPNWRTCVFLGHIDDAKTIALYRIGIQEG